MSGVSLITGGKGQSERCVKDFYPTPSASTISLFKSNYIDLSKIKTVLEPAAGEGHISEIAKEYLLNSHFTETDLFEYENKNIESGIDFLTHNYNKNFDLVITNPPYSKNTLMPFVKKSLEISNKYVVMFLKITFLESSSRYKFFKDNKNLKHILCFSNRQPVYKNGINTKAGNAIMYAWFIWDKEYAGLPTLDWIDNSNEIKQTNKY